MERKKALVRYGLGGLIPGALLGAGCALLVIYSNQRQTEMPLYMGVGTALGAVIGAVVGALIADHRYPP